MKKQLGQPCSHPGANSRTRTSPATACGVGCSPVLHHFGGRALSRVPDGFHRARFSPRMPLFSRSSDGPFTLVRRAGASPGVFGHIHLTVVRAEGFQRSVERFLETDRLASCEALDGHRRLFRRWIHIELDRFFGIGGGAYAEELQLLLNRPRVRSGDAGTRVDHAAGPEIWSSLPSMSVMEARPEIT